MINSSDWKPAGMNEGWQKRAIICVIGILFQGFFLSFLIEVNLGTDPFTFMNVAISDRIGWTFGNWQLVLNIALFAIVVLTSRLHFIGIGTIANMVLIGYIADFCRFLWNLWIPESVFTQNSTKIPVFIVTLAGFLIAAAVYMNAGMGLSPYDAPPSIFCARFTRLPYFIVRMVWDFTAILIGLLAGGRPTIANLIMAVALGPVISAIGRWMKKYLKM
jgi:uncharacterized protein